MLKWDAEAKAQPSPITTSSWTFPSPDLLFFILQIHLDILTLRVHYVVHFVLLRLGMSNLKPDSIGQTPLADDRISPGLALHW